MQPKIVKVIDVQIFPVCAWHADIRTCTYCGKRSAKADAFSYGCARCGYPLYSRKVGEV